MNQTINPTTTTSPEEPTSGAAVSVRGIAKSYRGARALDGVDLEIRAGEFLTLLGSSGSGKSTLLNIIAGFCTATSGQVIVDGEDLTKVAPHKRDLGMVFQHYALFPHMSVFDNVAFPLRRRKTSKEDIAQRVQEALDVVELGHLTKRMPSELSGGQQQRVALARAIVFRPRLLLLDEPLGALDRRLREQLQLEVKRLHRDLGITFVFVTHDQEEALAMSDRIALLRDGQIVQIGTPEELYERPAELYAAQFLGESNVFPGVVESGTFRDEASGAELGCTSRTADGPGSLVVRPENLDVTLLGQPLPMGHNALSGTISEVTYLGSVVRVEVTLPDGRRLVARTGTAQRGLVVGASAVATWSNDRCQIVSDAEPAVQQRASLIRP